MHIPPSYAPQVMGYLLRAGVITVKNGRGGGYRLARRPSDVTLLEVVEAAEGDLTSKRCPLRGVPCFVGSNCALHPGLSASLDVFKRSLAGTRLADVTPSGLARA
jgi:Rrf2 family protein